MTDIPFDKKITLPVNSIYTNNIKKSNRNITLIHEDEAIRIVMRVRSKDPKIIKFQKWVAKVIRTIRKTGSYGLNPELTLKHKELDIKQQQLNNDTAKLKLSQIQLQQNVKNECTVPQNKRFLEQYIVNFIGSQSSNSTNPSQPALTCPHEETYMNVGVVQLAVEAGHSATLAQKKGSSIGRYVCKKFKAKYPNETIGKGREIFSANNASIRPNTYKYKYKDELIGWINEYMQTLS